MDKYITELLNMLDVDLQRIAMEAETIIKQAEASFYYVESLLRKLKDFITGYEFKDEFEEIKFFKITKPTFLKELIYYQKLYNIEARKPVGTEESQKEYYRKEARTIEEYFSQHIQIYNYYRTERSLYDYAYFVRANNHDPMEPLYKLDTDFTFSTPHSSIFAELQAYEKLQNYIAVRLNTTALIHPHGEKRKERAVWSASKVDFVEMSMGLYYSGSVNFGKGGFDKFIRELAGFFNIDVGNVPRVVYSMVIRKKDQTPFMKAITQAAQKKLDEKTE